MPSYQQRTCDLIRNREYERVWQRHCGFLDLTLSEVMQVQLRLLAEQFDLARKSRLWQSVFPQAVARLQAGNFRDLVPLTTYADYEPHLCTQPQDALAVPTAGWARTSGRGDHPKWVPYSQQALDYLGEMSLSTLIIAAAHERGDVRIRPHDVCVTNLPARPYLSGWMQFACSQISGFHYIPGLDETEQLSFQERNEAIFKQAMIEGMDTLGAMTIVLVKMGEAFASGANRKNGFSLQMLNPRLLWRVAGATRKARREGRKHFLPRDLWTLKCLQCGGTDTAVFKEQIKAYWGVYPHESYACTEAGFLATQGWDYGDMIFIPTTAFLEFIPESAWEAERLHGIPPKETLLLDQIEVGKRYEVVISSFYGGPFLRYRMHDLIEVTAVGNPTLGIHLPQFRFVGRSGDFIDLSGFAGLIDERQMLCALAATGISYRDWVLCKEITENETLLHLYIELEPQEQTRAEEISQRVDTQIKQLNPDYANIETMLGFVPLRVTVLSQGTFDRYMKYQVQRGADLAHLKPMRIQPSAQALQALLQMSQKDTRPQDEL